ncbi:MAG: DUF2975 domain-containing protein [Spirosomataceae bacterium]
MVTLSPKNVFKGLQFIFWVIFIGLCVKTGILLVSTLVSLQMDPENLRRLWIFSPNSSEPTFHQVLQLDLVDYVQLMGLYIFLYASKAFVAYLVIKLCLDFPLDKPFTIPIAIQFKNISRSALVTGFIAFIGSAYSKWLTEAGFSIPIAWGTEEILFFAAILYVIAYIFQKGMDLQQENDLTI